MSKKPSRERKKFYSMQEHERSKATASHLNEKLRKETGKRALPIRKGDTVKIMRGDNAGKEGKVTLVQRQRGIIYVEKIIVKKSKGEEKQVPIQASKVMIIELDKSDKKRLKTRKAETKQKNQE
jgi:large subunit ribosomal protein L24